MVLGVIFLVTWLLLACILSVLIFILVTLKKLNGCINNKNDSNKQEVII